MPLGSIQFLIEKRPSTGSKRRWKPSFSRQSVSKKILILSVILGTLGTAIQAEVRPAVRAKPEDRKLEGLKEKSRRVLVLFGWDEKEAEKPVVLPVDTMTGDLLQAPLEWLGYETDYLNVGTRDLPQEVTDRYSAVLLDGELSLPIAKERAAVEWLLRLKGQGVQLFFVGGQPIRSDEARMILAKGLGLKGTLEPVTHVEKTAIATQDRAMMAGEVEIQPRASSFHDLAAPAGARVMLGLQGRGADGELLQFDPLFLADWGGMWLEPYVVFRGSSDSNLFYGEPYRILGALLAKNGVFPAPDVTTRDGERIFYSHIDGDGFATPSSFKGHPLCAELVRDRILKVFPFPVTVSIIEAEIRAEATGYPKERSGEFEEMARSIFSMPNVQPASHSYSHPYQWDRADPNPGIYDEPHMPIKSDIGYDVIDADREIRGSIDYINQKLLPAGKKVELMLWSGNCRPGEQALRVCRELGVENMNGGNTIVSRRYPGMAGVAARVMPWGDELQIHAANQNEFMYANGWNGPFFGGFADVIDTFERTEAGRRTKPVNVYYHFYSATSLSSLRALEKIHRWCAEANLHSITALQYAQIAKDAWRTKVYEKGPRHWVLTNEGHLRTYRLPVGMGRPDLKRCVGVTGYREHQEALYVHTDGRKQVEIALGDDPLVPTKAEESHMSLASSSAEIQIEEHTALLCRFQVKDLRPVKTTFAGMLPKTVCDLTINAATSRVTADESGVLSLSLPPSAEVTLDATRSQYAALR